MTHPLLQMNDEGLLPCPLCENQAKLKRAGRNRISPWYKIRCENLDCGLSLGPWTDSGLKRRWNNSGSSQALRAAEETIEAMAKALEASKYIAECKLYGESDEKPHTTMQAYMLVTKALDLAKPYRKEPSK